MFVAAKLKNGLTDLTDFLLNSSCMAARSNVCIVLRGKNDCTALLIVIPSRFVENPAQGGYY